MDALTEELKRLDKQGAVRELSEAEVERTKAWTPLIVKQKPNGKWRMITDLRSLNGCFRTAKFKQQTWKTIRGVLELSGAKWGTKLDVREFFHHLGLCRETQRWVRFQGKEGKYQAKAMPFGLAASPFWANKFAKVLQAALNKKKINHLWYVDDVLVLGDTAQQCAEKTNEALQILDNLGVQLNKEKCELEPKEQVEYLGMNIDLKNGCIAALTSRLNAVCREVTKLKHAGSTCATRLARVAGKLEYLQVGMPSAIGLGKQLMFEAGKLAEKHGWMKTTTKNDKVHGLLKTIQQALKITTPNPINRPWKQKSNLTTDASDFGWGAVLEGPKMKKTSRGLFSRQEVREHITRKEVFAIELAVRNLSPKIPDQSHLEVWTDCTVTAAVWRKGSVKEKLMKGVTETILLLAKRGISMSTQWIPGEKNTKADKLSRKYKTKFPLIFHHLNFSDTKPSPTFEFPGAKSLLGRGRHLFRQTGLQDYYPAFPRFFLCQCCKQRVDHNFYLYKTQQASFLLLIVFRECCFRQQWLNPKMRYKIPCPPNFHQDKGQLANVPNELNLY
jgi:hypothetical protein